MIETIAPIIKPCSYDAIPFICDKPWIASYRLIISSGVRRLHGEEESIWTVYSTYYGTTYSIRTHAFISMAMSQGRAQELGFANLIDYEKATQFTLPTAMSIAVSQSPQLKVNGKTAAERLAHETDKDNSHS